MDELWVLLSEDGDGDMWGFRGIFSSKELAFGYSKKAYYRELTKGEEFFLEPSKNYIGGFPGRYVTIEDSWDVVLRKGTGAWIRYVIEKVEINKE